MTPELAAGALDAAAAGMVALGIWLAATKSLGVGTWVLAAQSLLLDSPRSQSGPGAGRPSWWLAAC